MDLIEIEEDLGAEETISSVFPPFCMKILTESLQLAFQLHVEVCPRVSSVHLDLIGLQRQVPGEDWIVDAEVW